MYVAVKGGRKAIEAAHGLLAEARRGDPSLPEISPDQIRNQLALAVDRVQAEGSLYCPELAALAVKQAWGDLVEAVFLLRAARATLERFGYSEPVETSGMRPARRISGTFKDLPGGQILGPTFDYTHRLLNAVPLPDGTDGKAPPGSGAWAEGRPGADASGVPGREADSPCGRDREDVSPCGRDREDVSPCGRDRGDGSPCGRDRGGGSPCGRDRGGVSPCGRERGDGSPGGRARGAGSPC
ncbi:MAG: carbon-phosphorus lyase complex subunit PhnI, partial [Deltaproteobacteria bacterium]|nr:carbon-phosphorus lyase complex subunit PhnI [Deltaproteobacteria bacterium]